MAVYCLDSDVLVQAKNVLYAFDVVPSFWNWLAGEFENGSVTCTRSVYGELMQGKDELSEWARNRRQYFIIPDKSTQDNFSLISMYVLENYKRAQANKFLNGADPWGIAHCMTHSHIMVTNEQRVTIKSERVKIPNVCDEFNVKCVKLIDMMRALKAQL